MSLDVVVFKAIDYIFDHLQNRRLKIKKYKKNIDVEKNIIYSSSNKKICKLDLYKPKNVQGKLPVIFVIHGGGFVAGDKKYRKELCYWFSKETNAVCICPNYGLGPKYLFPQSIKHLQDAMNWVYDNAEKYNLDLSKFLVTGDSAGGYYAAELCAIQESMELQEKLDCHPKCKFTGAMLDCGIYDIDKALSAKVLFNISGKVCKNFTGTDVEQIKEYEYYTQISPLNHITETYPKTCVVYSENDFFCGGQGQDLIKKLKEHNVYVESYGSKKYLDNHTFQLVWNSKAAKEANKLFIDFANFCFLNNNYVTCKSKRNHI